MLKAASGDAANIYAQMKKRHFRDGINHKVVWIIVCTRIPGRAKEKEYSYIDCCIMAKHYQKFFCKKLKTFDTVLPVSEQQNHH